jgi:hypothetical protein
LPLVEVRAAQFVIRQEKINIITHADDIMVTLGGILVKTFKPLLIGVVE